MLDYEFTLRFALRGVMADPRRHLPALGRAGFDARSIDVGKHGRIALRFVRGGRSADAAVQSALDEARKVLRGARLMEVSPDLVGLSDIAYLAGCTRQNLRKLSLGHPAFPIAVHEGNTELFHLADALAWLRRTGRRRVPEAMTEIAETARVVNVGLQVRALRTRGGLFWRLTTRNADTGA